MKLIREVVAYAEPRFKAHGARVDFTLTTNATLLTEALVDWFDEHRFGITVSMDGPKTLHDRNRITVGGKGSYDVVRKKVDMLLARYRARPVGCRVTLTSGVTDVEEIFRHLHEEIRFHEVGFGPVTSGPISTFNLTGDELADVFAGMKRLGRRYLEQALQGHNFAFGNMHQLMTDIYEGNKKQLPCGAGVALGRRRAAGGGQEWRAEPVPPLHRFGHAAVRRRRQGHRQARLASFIELRLDRKGSGCETCRIRNLCSGGCYHESYAKYGDANHPTYHYCDLMRDWVDYGVEIYSRIMLGNPGFFERHVSTRRSA